MDSPHKHPFIVFATVGMALLMSTVDTTIVAVGLSTMLRELNTTLPWIGWTLTAYTLVLTVVLPIAGKLSDEFGRKRLFLAAVVLFTLSSMAAGLSSNVYMLIACRVLQAAGGAAFVPSATGIVSDVFGNKRAAAIGLFSSILPMGGILGPNIGGLIIDHLSWRWIFYVNVPIGLAIIVLGLFILPRSRPQGGGSRIDVIGAVLFAASIVFILYAMTIWGNEPSAMADPTIWTFFALAAIMFVLFLRHEARTEAPVMDLKLFAWRPFLAANIYNLFYGSCIFGLFSFIPYYGTVVYGMGPSESGLILTPRSIGMAVMSAVSSFFLIRFGYRRPIIIGTIMMAAGLLMMGFGFRDANLLGLTIPDMGLVGSFVLVIGLGGGLIGPSSNNAALELMPGKVAAVTGMRAMFRQMGGVFGAATVVLTLSHFEDKGAGAQIVFFAMGVLLLTVIPVVFLIPDFARERHLAEMEGELSAEGISAVGAGED